MGRKIKEWGREYKKRLFEAMLSDYSSVYCTCKNCGNPTHKTYTCRHCGEDPQ